MIQPAQINPYAHLQLNPIDPEHRRELIRQLVGEDMEDVYVLEGLDAPAPRPVPEVVRQNIAQLNIAELVPQFAGKRTCAKCVKNAGAKFCEVHGSDYIDHKCLYCCAPALYNCGGEYYFCAYHHHDGKHKPDYEEKKLGMGGDCQGDISKCDLGINHIPNLPYKGNIFPEA